MEKVFKPIVTLSLRCYKRPQRTRRMIECVLAQTIHNWELLLTGDNCPEFQKRSFIQFVERCQEKAIENGNRIIFRNNAQNNGGCGFSIINQHIGTAKGDYFLFLSNDDIIDPTHIAARLSFMEEKKDLDFAYFDTWVEPYQQIRDAKLQQGSIGHSEIMVKRQFLGKMPFHGPEYGHDWELVKNMMKATVFYEKGTGRLPTYWVMSVPGLIEQGID